MKILFESDLAGSRKYGMTHRIYQFSEEFIRRGHEVMIVGASYSHVRRENPIVKDIITKENINGIEYRWIKSPKYQRNGLDRVIHMIIYNFRLWKNAKKIANEFKPDIVIAAGVTPLDFIGCYRIAQKANAKVILEVGDLWPLTPIELGGYSRKHPFIQIMQQAENYAYAHTDGVVSLLPYAHEYMKKHGLRDKPFFYIPNGVVLSSINEIIPKSYETIIEQKRLEGKFLIGYAGSFSQANNIHSLIEAAQILNNSEFEIYFFLLGQGPLKEIIEQKIKDSKLKNITLLNALPKSQVLNFLIRMDALYIGFKKQSIYRFGISPNKIFDYMMAGKPIIQAIDAGNNLVKEANCGIYVEPENIDELISAILKLKSLTPEQRTTLGNNGKEYVIKNHSYDILANNYLESISSIINGNKS
jgi:glycosyltransferase involved in cell wall biosynthesis